MNDICQTTASAGEVLAAGMAFSIPALVMIGYWNSFPFGLMVCISGLGGLLGVLLSIPLRRAMIIEGKFKFPEGIATAEVLKAGDKGAGARHILFAGLAAGFIKFCQSGFQILQILSIFGVALVIPLRGSLLVSKFAALIGGGYIIGLNICLIMLLGAGLAWFVGVPLYGSIYGIPI